MEQRTRGRTIGRTLSAMPDDELEPRGAADRDVDEFRSELRGVRGELRELRGDLTTLRRDVHKGFIEMRGRFDATAAGQQRIVELLESLGAGEQG